MDEREVLEYMDARAGCMADAIRFDTSETRQELVASMCDWRKADYYRRWRAGLAYVPRTRADRAGMQARYGEFCRGQRGD